MIAIVIGLTFIAVGGFGVLCWFKDFLTILRGVLPLSLVLGGIAAVLTGVSSFQKHRGGDDSSK